MRHVYKNKPTNPTCRNTTAHQLILQKNEQLYKLLAIAVAMCPSTTRWLEENVREQLQFKCSDELFEMQSSNVDAFKKAFGLGCPKFVTAAAPDLSEVPTDNHLVGYHEALQIFVKEVISSPFFLLNLFMLFCDQVPASIHVQQPITRMCSARFITTCRPGHLPYHQ